LTKASNHSDASEALQSAVTREGRSTLVESTTAKSTTDESTTVESTIAGAAVAGTAGTPTETSI
jgi:hypothetical protein